MTPTRRSQRAAMSDLAKRLGPQRTILDVGIAGDDPPGAHREFFLLADGGSFTTLDRDAALNPDILLDITQDVPAELAHTFDLVICSQVLEHVWDLQAAAASLWLLTSHAGHCIVDVPFLYPPHGDGAEHDDFWRLTPAALKRLLHTGGFPHVEAWADAAWLNSHALARKAVTV